MVDKISKPRVLLVGDSHVDAVRRAIKLRMMARKVPDLEIYRLAKMKNNRMIGDMTFDDILVKVSNFSKNDLIVSFFGGNQHAVLATIQHPNPFDFYLAGVDGGFRAGAEVIPLNVVKDYLSSGIEGSDGQRLRSLRRATVARCFHVIPPPPKESAEHILKYHETYFANQEIVAQGISSASLRYKAWELQARILEDLCESLDISTIRPPEKALTEQGYLAPDYYAQDATHANSDYGELLLGAIETIANDGDKA